MCEAIRDARTAADTRSEGCRRGVLEAPGVLAFVPSNQTESSATDGVSEQELSRSGASTATVRKATTCMCTRDFSLYVFSLYSETENQESSFKEVEPFSRYVIRLKTTIKLSLNDIANKVL